MNANIIHSAEEELERLYRNVDRRNARERAKGIVNSPGGINSPMGDDDEVGAGTPHGAGPGTGKRGGRKKVNPEGTGRRCANCGQIGHIKTNKKSVSFSLSTIDEATPLEKTEKLELRLVERRWLCGPCEANIGGVIGAGFGFAGMQNAGAKPRRSILKRRDSAVG